MQLHDAAASTAVGAPLELVTQVSATGQATYFIIASSHVGDLWLCKDQKRYVYLFVHTHFLAISARGAFGPWPVLLLYAHTFNVDMAWIWW